jgi:UDP-glucose 6-dehydrogenase
MRGIGLEGRIGQKFPHPGPGVGGSCFPKDTLPLVRIYGAPPRLVENVVAVNDARNETMATRVIAACGGTVRRRTIAVLGLTFKPETDDMRDAPTLAIIARLIHGGAAARPGCSRYALTASSRTPAGIMLMAIERGCRSRSASAADWREPPGGSESYVR